MPIEAIFLSAIAIIFLVVAFVCIGLGIYTMNEDLKTIKEIKEKLCPIATGEVKLSQYF